MPSADFVYHQISMHPFQTDDERLNPIKEKVLAARRVGIREVILPRQNEKNINEDLTEELRKELTVHYVQSVDEVLLLALLPAVPASDRKERRPQPPLQ